MFEDEQIAEKRYWERRKKYTDIETGIYSRDELLLFSEKRLFHERVGVMLPDTFQDMDSDEARRKYHSEQRPQVIKTNRDGSINFAFNLTGPGYKDKQPEAVIRDFRYVMKRLYPTNICLNTDTGPEGELPFAWIEFTNSAVNANLYNMLSLYSMGDELLMLLFNCPFEERTEWLHCLSKIRETVVEYKEED